MVVRNRFVDWLLLFTLLLAGRDELSKLDLDERADDMNELCSDLFD